MSNGTMLTPREADNLDNFGRVSVTISIDSFVKETYQKMRAGAQYERVMAHLFNVLAKQDWPNRKLTVAMIIGKSNLLDLAENIRFALQHDIRLMINPILQYPPTERLDLFADFDAQTRGWNSVLDMAAELLEEPRRQHHRTLVDIDPTEVVRYIRLLYARGKEEHVNPVTLTVDLHERACANAAS